MKKLLAVLVSLSLVSNGSLYSMTRIKETTKRGVARVGQFGTDVAAKTRRYWRCLTTPAKHVCSAEERKKARKWLIYTPTAIIASLLIAAGIVATGALVAQMKEEDIGTFIINAHKKFTKEYQEVLTKKSLPLPRLKRLGKNLDKTLNKIDAALKKVHTNILSFPDKIQDKYFALELMKKDVATTISQAEKKFSD